MVPLPLLCGDTILHEEIDKDMPANTAWAIYPCDYFAGTVGVYFDAVTADGVPVPVHGRRSTART